MYVTYEYTGNSKIPAIIKKGEYSSPVWIQQEWDTGEFSQFIRHNGCGHCCMAMALNLNGIKIDPHEEFCLCRKMWGEPRYGEPLFEENYMSQTGIAQIIKSFGIPAFAYGVEESKTAEAAEYIMTELSSGKMVILWSHPSKKLPNNPFSSGEHYILLAGFAEDGRIFVANSSTRSATKDGVQFTDIETIEKVLFEGTRTTDYTWGRHDFTKSGAYIVVG